MAEVKNSFLASRMNKDLDDRLIPSNEYREAFNIAISQSEDSDVGAIENIRGTSQLQSITGGTFIGYVTDEAKDNIYLFWTSYTDTSANKLNNHQNSSSGTGTDSRIYRYNVGLDQLTTIVSGRWLNFSTTHHIYGVNILENLLFWTDNRNQPRKINIVTAFNNTSHYSGEDHVSVAKFAPYAPIELFKDYGGSTGYAATMQDVVSATLPDSTANPWYNADYSGDTKYLEDKFVRFSYRFKYEDGEYSTMAPFTQIAFIPKQDGSFLTGQEDEAYKSTIVSFMENKVNYIALQLPLPLQAQYLASGLKIEEVDILYKESDSNVISVLDTVTVDTIEAAGASATVYEYDYQSTKPIKTLPEAQTTRVYDKTPVKALSQEVSGNRVIYGNYVNKHTAPSSLNYQVKATQKLTSGAGYDYANIEYPEHTLKRNRNYQVGFVLADRYGRESDVILSSAVSNNLAGNSFGASTFYFPYKPSHSNPATVLADIGNSIKIQLNEKISSTLDPLSPDFQEATGEPGLYDSSTNPLGWYSYKIVVKQNQQEYYNVYLSGIVDGYLAGTTDVGKIAHAALVGDNINKIPRELQEVGPDQTLYSADTVLYPIVENQISGGNTTNIQVYPGTNKYNTVTIADFDQLNKLGQTGYSTHIYNEEENPLIVRIQTPVGLGETEANGVLPDLAVVETEPFESNLDIYYETSSTGLISDLNSAVLTDTGSPAVTFSDLGYEQNENQDYTGGGTTTGASDSAFVTDAFFPKTAAGANMTTATITSFTTQDGSGNNRTSAFGLNTTGNTGTGYRIKILENFYYGPTAATNESYTFTFGIRNDADTTAADVNGATTSSLSVTVDNITTSKPIFVGHIVTGTGIPANTTVTGITAIDMSSGVRTATFTLNQVATLANNAALTFTAPSYTLTAEGLLSNIAPTINSFSYPSPLYYSLASSESSPLITFTGVNGTTKSGYTSSDLVWEFESPSRTVGNIEYYSSGTGASEFALNKSSGKLWRSFIGIPATNTFKIRLRDAGGMVSGLSTVTFDFTQGAFSDAFATAFDI